MRDQLRRRLYVLAFVDVFGPLYALYTIWFADHGISTRQVSAVFLLWGGLPILFEVPSGALADRVDRRRLLAAASALRATGIGVWMLWPTFAGALVGAALWSLHTASFSGAWEALIHDQLDDVGHADRYGVVMARIGQFASLGVAAGTVAASGLLAVGLSIELLGWVTVAVHLVSITLVLRLPGVRSGHEYGSTLAAEGTAAVPAWWRTLREGFSTVRHSALVVRIIVIGACTEGLAEIDEYVPLVARDRGASDTVVPLLILAIWVGLLVGGEVVVRGSTSSRRTVGIALVGASAAFGAGLAGSGVAWLLLIACGYGALEVAMVLTDARLQERTPRATRATVTSVRGLVAGIVNLGFFATVAVLADGDDATPGLWVSVVALLVVGAVALRWLPPAGVAVVSGSGADPAGQPSNRRSPR